ncbi:hypothetical protein [Enterococcus sp. AZ072]|uniref:hypothetical protein n=1 Tax=unclassified Enterococcus TaxID=2608891 RepID=UPI003D2C8AE9
MKLGMKQVTSMKKVSLEKRFNDYYTKTKDSVLVIQCAIAAAIRNSFSTSDFSFLAQDLIRSLFLTDDAVRSIPLSCVYFRDYFSDDEWQTVINRLFSSPEEFEQITGESSIYIEKLRPRFTSGEQSTDKKTSMISYFKDAAGKRHSWTLSNINPDITKEEHYALLSILGTLTIFEKDGVRRFVEPIYADFRVFEPGFDRRNEEEAAELQKMMGSLLPITTKEIPEAVPSFDQTAALQEQLIDSIDDEIENEEDDLYDDLTELEKELPDLAMKLILEGKPIDEVQQAIDRRKEEQAFDSQAVPVGKTLSNKERFQQVLAQKNRSKQNKSSLLNQINRRGKRR